MNTLSCWYCINADSDIILHMAYIASDYRTSVVSIVLIKTSYGPP